MEFNISDRVRVKNHGIKSKKMSGCEGEIIDKLFSANASDFLYSVKFDEFDRSYKLWAADELELCEDCAKYAIEFEYLDTLVVARLYEVTDERKTEISKNHGHIIHDGALGIVQAASFALSRLYKRFGEEVEDKWRT